MSIQVSAADANRRFSELLRAATDGEDVLITRHGRTVAKLSAYEDDMAVREAAKQALLERIQSQPALNLPRITRDEMYDDIA